MRLLICGLCLGLALPCSNRALSQTRPDDESPACKVDVFTCALASSAFDILTDQPDAMFLEDLADMRSSATTQQQKEQVTFAERQRAIHGVLEDEKRMYAGDEVPSLRVHEAVMADSTCMLLLTGNNIPVAIFSKRQRDCEKAINEASHILKGSYAPGR
jgi:hypothetical protein